MTERQPYLTKGHMEILRALEHEERYISEIFYLQVILRQ